MSTQRFYLFGVPDGFNMLSGTPEEIKYFQTFYNGSKAGIELTVHRRKNGETSYNYLVRNITSSKGREGSFLGISVVFTGNEYCYNISKIKALFDAIYKDVILKESIILQPITTGQGPVARFCISKFADAKEHYDKVGRILLHNIQQSFTADIRRYDASFINQNRGQMRYLPLSANELSFVNALKEFDYVTLSSEVKEQQTSAELAPFYLSDLSAEIEEHQNYVIMGYERLLNQENINNEIAKITEYINILQKHTHQAGVEDLLRKYINLKEKFLNIPVNENTTASTLSTEATGHSAQADSTNTQTRKPTKPTKPILSQKALWFITAIIAVVIIGVFFIPQAEEPQPEPPVTEETTVTSFDRKVFDSLLEEEKFAEAFAMVDSISNTDRRNGYITEIQNSIGKWYRDKAVNELTNRDSLRNIKSKIGEYGFYAKQAECIEEINQRIEDLNSEQTRRKAVEKAKKDAIEKAKNTTAETPLPDIILTRTDSDWRPKENGTKKISRGTEHIINAKKGHHYLITGGRWTVKNRFGGDHNKLQYNPTTNGVKIDTNYGHMTLELNEDNTTTTITFKVENK